MTYGQWNARMTCQVAADSARKYYDQQTDKATSNSKFIEGLIEKYTDRVKRNKKLNQKLNNDVLEGIILTLEDVIEDLEKAKI